jgi:nitrate/nitrite-specific signal transduction histidine kinase
MRSPKNPKEVRKGGAKKRPQASADASNAGMAVDDFAIEVADDGQGIDAKRLADADSKGHFGLSELRARLSLFGGRLDIHSEDGRGTRMTILVPQALMKGSA